MVLTILAPREIHNQAIERRPMCAMEHEQRIETEKSEVSKSDLRVKLRFLLTYTLDKKQVMNVVP